MKPMKYLLAHKATTIRVEDDKGSFSRHAEKKKSTSSISHGHKLQPQRWTDGPTVRGKIAHITVVCSSARNIAKPTHGPRYDLLQVPFQRQPSLLKR